MTTSSRFLANQRGRTSGGKKKKKKIRRRVYIHTDIYKSSIEEKKNRIEQERKREIKKSEERKEKKSRLEAGAEITARASLPV